MSTPTFRPRAIQHTVAAQLIAISVIAYASLRGWESAYAWAIPIMLSVAAVGMKFAAPLIPKLEIFFVVLIAFIVNVVTDWAIAFTGIPLLTYAGDLVIALMCVYGFGLRWAKRGFLPQSAVAWSSHRS